MIIKDVQLIRRHLLAAEREAETALQRLWDGDVNPATAKNMLDVLAASADEVDFALVRAYRTIEEQTGEVDPRAH